MVARLISTTNLPIMLETVNGKTYIQEFSSSTELRGLSVRKLALFIRIVKPAWFVQCPGLYYALFSWIII